MLLSFTLSEFGDLIIVYSIHNLFELLMKNMSVLQDKTEVVPYNSLKKALTALATINGDETTIHMSKNLKKNMAKIFFLS